MNKFTTFRLIARARNRKIATNMINCKCSEYCCLLICNIDDNEVVD